MAAATKEECVKTFEGAMQFFNFVEARFKSDILDFYEECLRNQNKKKTGKGRPRKNRREVEQNKTSKREDIVSLPVIVEEQQPDVNRRTFQRSAAKKASSIITQHASIKLNCKLRNPNSSSVASTSSAIIQEAEQSGSYLEESSNAAAQDPDVLSMRDCSVVIERCNLSTIQEALEPARHQIKTQIAESAGTSNDNKNVKVDIVANLETDKKSQTKPPSLKSDSSEKPVQLTVISSNSESLISSPESLNCTNARKNNQNPTSDESEMFLKPSTSKAACVETTSATDAPSFLQPKRIRTKNRLYNNDDYHSVPLKKKSKLTTPQIKVTEASMIEPAKCSQAKRKSDSEDDSSCLQKKPRLDLSEQRTTEKRNTANNNDSKAICSTNDQANLQGLEESSIPSTSGGSRSTSEDHKENTIPLIQQIPQRVFVDAETPVVPEGRVTRTRTKEMNKGQKKAALLTSTEKENKIPISLIKTVIYSGKKNTPLKTNNQIFSPFKGKICKEKKDDEKKNKVMSKLDAATLKKKNQIQTNIEELKKKNEEKEQKRLAVELARNKEKQEKLEKLLKEQAAKEKQIEKAKKLKEEKVLHMKQFNNAQLKGAEERRLKEEELKRARIKKMEEEKKRVEEERLKQMEEAKKLHEARLAQQAAAAKPLALKENAKKVLPDKKMDVQSSSDEYNMTPNRSERAPIKPKNSKNYGISDDDADDSTDEESNPKKIIPKWAGINNRKEVVIAQSKISAETLTLMFPQYIDLDVVKSSARCRARASSAIWDSPVVE